MSQIILNRNIKTEDYDTLNKLIDKSITTVTEDMLSGETVIDDYAFYYCSSLVDVVIPNSIITIGNDSFGYCHNITNITIPSSVVSIGNFAFEECSSLSNVTVKSITPPTLGSNVFQSASSLSAIYVPAESVDTYKSASGWSRYVDIIQAIPISNLYI